MMNDIFNANGNESIRSSEAIDLSELSAQNVDLLRRFMDCLIATDNEPATEDLESGPEIGLYQLFEAFTAQRHELKLFTKSGRQTQELLQHSIEETSKAVDALSRFRRERPEIERKAVTPFVSSLIEIDESLLRTKASLKTLQERLTALVRTRIETVAAAYCDSLSWWNRLWRRTSVLRFADHLAERQTAEIEQILEPFLVGFDMLIRRMNDILEKHAIKRLNPLGEPVDPETMRVVAIVESDVESDVDSNAVPAGHVVEVVRYGYLRQGKPLRFADVRAVR